VLATPRAINQAIAKYYAPGQRDEEKATAAPAAAKGAKGKAAAPAAKGKKEKPAKTSKDDDTAQLNKPLLGIWGVILMIPVFFEVACMVSNSALLFARQYPILNKGYILSILGGAATFAYIHFKLKKKK
jgi:hypothetical protein